MAGGATERRSTWQDAPVSDLHALTVRRATAADIPALVELRVAFDQELAGGMPMGPADEHRARIDAYLRSHVPDGRFRVWVADAAGEVVGMAGLVVVDRPPHPRSRRAPEAMVFNVMTTPAWRRRGVGRAVMGAVIADGRALGCRRLLLRTSDDGSHLYAALGFADPGNWRQLDLD
jgi:GNAT superfamily N-acetyltransferase